MHIEEILKGMGKEVNRNSKGGLGGSIGMYVRKGIVFTRPGPNIFGLVEFETPSIEEPPPDFGTPA